MRLYSALGSINLAPDFQNEIEEHIEEDTLSEMPANTMLRDETTSRQWTLLDWSYKTNFWLCAQGIAARDIRIAILNVLWRTLFIKDQPFKRSILPMWNIAIIFFNTPTVYVISSRRSRICEYSLTITRRQFRSSKACLIASMVLLAFCMLSVMKTDSLLSIFQE